MIDEINQLNILIVSTTDTSTASSPRQLSTNTFDTLGTCQIPKTLSDSMISRPVEKSLSLSIRIVVTHGLQIITSISHKSLYTKP